MEVIRDMFESCCTESGSEFDHPVMHTVEDWNEFVRRMGAAGLVSDASARKLARVWSQLAPFGAERSVCFEDFQRHIMDKYKSGENLASSPLAGSSAQSVPRQAHRSLQTLQNKIYNLYDLCEEWTPNAEQVQQLLKISVELQNSLVDAESRVREIEQGQRGYLFSDHSNSASGSFVSPFRFQHQRARQVERACAESRIHGALVHVDNQGIKRASAFKLSDKLGHVPNKSLMVTLGQTKNGEMVEVVSLHGSASDGKAAAQEKRDIAFVNRCHSAHRELALSSHFPRWMGYHAAKQQLFFEHFPDAVRLDVLLQRHGVLIEPQPLLYSVLAQTISGMIDLVQMSTFAIRSPLSLRNVFLAERGSRVVLGHMDWGEQMLREDVRSLASRESTLVQSFGAIARQLLGMDVQKQRSSGSQTNVSSEPMDDGQPQFIFSRVECDVGLTVKPGDHFRLDLASGPRRIWRCVRISDAHPVDPAKNQRNPLSSQVVRVEDPERLELSAKAPGSCRLILKQVEWWQADDLYEIDPLKETDKIRGAVLLCKINVVDPSQDSDRSKCSPTLSAIMAACQPGIGGMNEVKLVNLREKYHILQSEFSSAEVSSDFDMYTGSVDM